MMARIVWPQALLDVLVEMPEKDRDLILEKTGRLQEFPEMYPVRARGRFSGCRWFFAENWLVYYRIVGRTVYMRGLWPARVP
jgi:hypothetical protein